MNKKTKILRCILSVGIVIFVVIILWKLAPFIKNLATVEGQLAFKEKINRMGFGGIFLLFALQIIQILLVILPGEPFEVLAGMCYGAWGGALFITISVFITTTIIFFTVRKLMLHLIIT